MNRLARVCGLAGALADRAGKMQEERIDDAG
jgi:hypothetical protein